MSNEHWVRRNKYSVHCQLLSKAFSCINRLDIEMIWTRTEVQDSVLRASYDGQEAWRLTFCKLEFVVPNLSKFAQSRQQKGPFTSLSPEGNEIFGHPWQAKRSIIQPTSTVLYIANYRPHFAFCWPDDASATSWLIYQNWRQCPLTADLLLMVNC